MAATTGFALLSISAMTSGRFGACGGLLFTVTMLAFGRTLYTLLGGRGGVLEQAMQYSHVLFAGAISIWLVNTLASVVRGTGDMRIPSVTLIGTALVQVAVGGALGLGLFGLPRLGMGGVAYGEDARMARNGQVRPYHDPAGPVGWRGKPAGGRRSHPDPAGWAAARLLKPCLR